MSFHLEPRRYHVMALNPFHGGSHRQFLSGVIEGSRHRWTALNGKPVHWKWRMRSAPLEMSRLANEAIAKSGSPDFLFCTDMLDLAAWRGLMRDHAIQSTPTSIYFHENQWTYPVSPHARPDVSFGYTNLQFAITADACWFNSEFHRRDFLNASEAFVRRMPDARSEFSFPDLLAKSKVIYPGFSPPAESGGADREADAHLPRPQTSQASRSNSGGDSGGDSPLTIGWVSRWEHDKRPDRFTQLLDRLKKSGVSFQLVLLGARPNAGNSDLESITEKHADRIVYNGFAERQEYERRLRQLDVVVSTADHEFFGIAICEAIWAGAVPILPNRLSYPELAPASCLYRDLEEAEALVRNLVEPARRDEQSCLCRRRIAPMTLTSTVSQIDESIDQLIDAAGS
ncbi:MAG: tRNA-queuosine alpha-mannosyltransferase domain-containing protein [Rubripirellula sp.]